MIASDEARVMTRPFRELRALAREPVTRGAAIAKLGLLLVAVGAFASFTSAGRLVAFHVASVAVFYVFMIVDQLVALAAARFVAARRADFWGLVHAHALGYGPWHLFMLAVSGMCLFAPNVGRAFFWLLSHGVLPLALVATIAWSSVLTYAAFRGALDLDRRRAGLATLTYYLTYVALVVGYYLAMDQIQPQLPGVP